MQACLYVAGRMKICNLNDKVYDLQQMHSKRGNQMHEEVHNNASG